MHRRWICRALLVALALVSPLVGACFDSADDCTQTVSCPPPDAGDASDTSTDGG